MMGKTEHFFNIRTGTGTWMQSDNDNVAGNGKVLSPAARRALKEAEERRMSAATEAPATEIGGRGGPDPARFGDWEINGRAIDF
jgi:hypothetical protein